MRVQYSIHLQKVVGTNTKTSISTEWEVTPPFRIALAMKKKCCIIQQKTYRPNVRIINM